MAGGGAGVAVARGDPVGVAPGNGGSGPKSTLGGVAIACSLPTVKFGFTWKSNNLAVSRFGNARAVELKAATASMYR